jgi:hypothetical protein
MGRAAPLLHCPEEFRLLQLSLQRRCAATATLRRDTMTPTLLRLGNVCASPTLLMLLLLLLFINPAHNHAQI